MNLPELIDTYRSSITQQVIDSYPPQFQPAEHIFKLPPLSRTPIGGQYDALQGVAHSLKTHRGTTLVGEMGTGKSYIGTAAAEAAGITRVLVLCPPHLVRKWKREVEQTIPNVQAAIATSITDLQRLRRYVPLKPLYVILSKERAKLTYRWKPAVTMTWAREGRYQLARDEETGEPFQVPRCPECHATITDDDGIPVTPKDLDRKKHWCYNCKGALWEADKTGPKRYALADYIKHHLTGFFQLLIADEVHQFKARGSAQGIAAGTLAEACDRSLTLTGTLMGGYSSTLFHLLYRFSPEIRTDFEENEVQRWVNHYGFIEKVVRGPGSDSDDYNEDGRTSKRKGYRTTIREIPGLAPSALFHLIGNTVFLRLSDVSSKLPPYKEEIMLTGMDREPDASGWSQASAYRHIYTQVHQALVDALKKGSKKLLATYLQTLLAYPDGCTRGETVIHPETAEIIAQVPPLDDKRQYPKEKQLVELVKEEKANGNRVLIYVTHTGTRDITGRMHDHLAEHGINAAVMKADTVSPDKREDWVADRVKQGADVLICHPKLVETGLDLIDFPVIAWYETEYSVYTMRQASRRSWRIGQTRPVRVVFMAYQRAIQADALKLVAKKLQSSLAVEGELPEDGLSSYGDDQQDLMLALAKQIVHGVSQETQSETIEEVFSQNSAAQAEAEEMLVTDAWVLPPPEPETASPKPAPTQTETRHQPDKEQLTLNWEEFLTVPNPNKPQPASQSLFEWAMAAD